MAVVEAQGPPQTAVAQARPGERGAARAAFEVHLDVFAGPFDLLLGLISKHQLDITEVALAQVTDEFVAHIRAAPRADLEQMTGFLVVAATLLDLKASRLLPSAGVEDEEDLALLEARDLLFARLLQYRAYKQVSNWLADALQRESRWTPRDVGLPDELAAVLPPLVLDITPERLAELAAAALAPRQPPTVGVDHVHAPRVNIAEHMAAVSEHLVAVGTASFRELCAGCHELIEVVARFLALLELFRESRVSFEQDEALGALRVRWAPPDTDPDTATERP
ncbi:MAG TPA: ScpA family protein [Mycobacteriales bacterium]|jgi:segregation and condensation protein A|nr:ScpA family protein [Mycobacteriales bacterium]